jgi:hypothetical protein
MAQAICSAPLNSPHDFAAGVGESPARFRLEGSGGRNAAGQAPGRIDFFHNLSISIAQ